MQLPEPTDTNKDEVLFLADESWMRSSQKINVFYYSGTDKTYAISGKIIKATDAKGRKTYTAADRYGVPLLPPCRDEAMVKDYYTVNGASLDAARQKSKQKAFQKMLRQARKQNPDQNKGFDR